MRPGSPCGLQPRPPARTSRRPRRHPHHLVVVSCRSILGRKLASGRNQPVRHGWLPWWLRGGRADGCDSRRPLCESTGTTRAYPHLFQESRSFVVRAGRLGRSPPLFSVNYLCRSCRRARRPRASDSGASRSLRRCSGTGASRSCGSSRPRSAGRPDPQPGSVGRHRQLRAAPVHGLPGHQGEIPQVLLLRSGLHHPVELHRVRAVELNRCHRRCCGESWSAWKVPEFRRLPRTSDIARRPASPRAFDPYTTSRLRSPPGPSSVVRGSSRATTSRPVRASVDLGTPPSASPRSAVSGVPVTARLPAPTALPASGQPFAEATKRSLVAAPAQRRLIQAVSQPSYIRHGISWYPICSTHTLIRRSSTDVFRWTCPCTFTQPAGMSSKGTCVKIRWGSPAGWAHAATSSNAAGGGGCERGRGFLPRGSCGPGLRRR